MTALTKHFMNRFAGILLCGLALVAGTPKSAFSGNCPVNESTSGCLLDLGKLPGYTSAIPGLPKGTIDATVVKVAAGKGATVRTWTAPDPREPGIMEDHIDIKGPLLHVHGIREGSHPYGVTDLAIRDPHIDLPCGLRVGQPIEKFIKALHPNLQPFLWKSRQEVRLEWNNYVLDDDICYASHANILLYVLPNGDVREVQWEYFAD